MGDFATLSVDCALPSTAARNYETWCDCARLLLGWPDDCDEIGRDLFAAGMSPLAAARHIVFGRAAAGGAVVSVPRTAP